MGGAGLSGRGGPGAKLGLAWPHALRDTCPLSPCQSVWTQIPQKGRSQGEGPVINRFQGLVWHRVPGGGGRLWEEGKETRAEPVEEPRGTRVSLTLCPQAMVVLGWQ